VDAFPEQTQRIRRLSESKFITPAVMPNAETIIILVIMIDDTKVDAEATGLAKYIVPGVYAQTVLRVASQRHSAFDTDDRDTAAEDMRYRNTIGMFVR
jgi:hypothetical protein